MRELNQHLTQHAATLADTRLMLTVGRDEQFPEPALDEATMHKLKQRKMVENAEQFAQTLHAIPGTQVEQRSLAEHDQFDMLAHAARRVLEFAFKP